MINVPANAPIAVYSLFPGTLWLDDRFDHQGTLHKGFLVAFLGHSVFLGSFLDTKSVLALIGSFLYGTGR